MKISDFFSRIDSLECSRFRPLEDIKFIYLADRASSEFNILNQYSMKKKKKVYVK